jgi:hypothetical protein
MSIQPAVVVSATPSALAAQLPHEIDSGIVVANSARQAGEQNWLSPAAGL